MLNRRQFLTHTLKGASLLALGPVVPQFLARTARAAEAGKDTILVVIEMSGGNDGLNTVIPYADDLYHKHRPTLRFTKEQVIRVNDELGQLDSALGQLADVLQPGGRAAIISFHSLEDRRVKWAFRNDPNLKVLTRKPITATAEEVRINPRARSAKLRVAERCPNPTGPPSPPTARSQDR